MTIETILHEKMYDLKSFIKREENKKYYMR